MTRHGRIKPSTWRILTACVLAGLAAGSGLPLAVIHRMHALPDVGESHCSALFAMNRATRDQHVYQLRILDYGGDFNLQQRPLITVYHPDQGNALAVIGWIGFIGVVSGVNDKGVALSEIGIRDRRGKSLVGEPMPFLLKNVLRYADTAEQGAAIVRAAPRTNAYIYFLGNRHGTTRASDRPYAEFSLAKAWQDVATVSP